jgi:hypothetical protein
MTFGGKPVPVSNPLFNNASAPSKPLFSVPTSNNIFGGKKVEEEPEQVKDLPLQIQTMSNTKAFKFRRADPNDPDV